MSLHIVEPLHRIDVNAVSAEQTLSKRSHDLLANTITQIAELFSTSCQVLTNISNKAKGTASRISQVQLRTRVDAIRAGVPRAEQICSSNQDFSDKKRVEYHSAHNETSQLFQAGSAAPPLLQRYHKATPPPNLSVMDVYRTDGHACLKFYSFPQFFIEQWIAEQEKKNQELRQKKEERRAAREARKANKSKKTETKVIKKVRKKRYDVDTGQEIRDDVPAAAPEASAAAPAPPVAAPRPAPTPAPRGAMSAPPAPPPGAMSAPPPPPGAMGAPPPPPPGPGLGAPAAPAGPAPGMSAPPPPPAQSFQAPPAPAAAPPPPAPGAPPPPAAPTALFSGGGFAAQLQQVQLSAGAPAPDSSSGGGLLAGIRQGITGGLKSAAERTLAPPKEADEPSGFNVSAILARRAALEMSSDSDSDSDSDWDD